MTGNKIRDLTDSVCFEKSTIKEQQQNRLKYVKNKSKHVPLIIFNGGALA